MTFTECFPLIFTYEMIRRKKWPDGVIMKYDKKTRTIECCHVTTCQLNWPPEKDFSLDDWIPVIDYGKDIGYQ